MALRYDLSRSTICDKRWEDFGGDGDRRLCDQCGHAVRDFRAMTDAEVRAAHASGRVCGVYTRTQLVRGGALPAEPPASVGRRFAGWAAALVALGWGGAARAQETPRPVPVAVPEADAASPASESKRLVVTGRVVDADTGEGLPGANVMARFPGQTPIGVTTDEEGAYWLDLSAFLGSEAHDIDIAWSFIGYATQTCQIAAEPGEVALRSELGTVELIGDLVVVGEPGGSVWARIRRWVGL